MKGNERFHSLITTPPKLENVLVPTKTQGEMRGERTEPGELIRKSRRILLELLETRVEGPISGERKEKERLKKPEKN